MRTAKHTPHNGRRSEAFEDVVKPLWFESFLDIETQGRSI